jgi:hypothetical protein
MSEIAAVAGLVGATGGFILLGVKMGTHFIDRAFSLERKPGDESPLVRPAHPSGQDWHASDAA